MLLRIVERIGILLAIAAVAAVPALAQSDVLVYRPVATGWSKMIYEMAQPTRATFSLPRQNFLGRTPVASNPSDPDGAVQSSPLPFQTLLTPGMNFEGLGDGFPGYNVQFAPPDTTGSVGLTQYVQWVNSDFAIFDKATGSLVTGGGPFSGKSLWAGFGGGCQTNTMGIRKSSTTSWRIVGSSVSSPSPPHPFCSASPFLRVTMPAVRIFDLRFHSATSTSTITESSE